MNRNEYELPQIEVVELELENAILQAIVIFFCNSLLLYLKKYVRPNYPNK